MRPQQASCRRAFWLRPHDLLQPLNAARLFPGQSCLNGTATTTAAGTVGGSILRSVTWRICWAGAAGYFKARCRRGPNSQIEDFRLTKLLQGARHPIRRLWPKDRDIEIARGGLGAFRALDPAVAMPAIPQNLLSERLALQPPPGGAS